MPKLRIAKQALWYVGGRSAYVSALLDGFTDYIFMTVDMADRPVRAKPAATGFRELMMFGDFVDQHPRWVAYRS
jgi:hypothetical protein